MSEAHTASVVERMNARYFGGGREMNDPASPADEDTLNLFALPYFLTTKEGQRQSRARVLLGAFNDSEGITAPKNDDFRNSAAMALRDFIRAAPSRHADDEEHKRFSEAILSAMALGIALSASGNTPRLLSAPYPNDNASTQKPGIKSTTN